MFKILNKPYPAPEPGIRSILISIGVGLFIGFFLAYFQPFDLDKVVMQNKTLKILGFGVISFFTVAIFNHFIPLFFPQTISDKNWTVGKEIFGFILMITCIAAFNIIYSNLIGALAFSFKNIIEMMASTFTLAIIPSTFMILLDHNRKLKKYVDEVQQLNIPVNPPQPKTISNINIQTDAANEQLTIKPDLFLYAEADGNYVIVFHHNNSHIEKKMYRTTLTKLDTQIPLEHIIKCHRSFIVNLDKVNDVKGNAQGFKLSLDASPAQVPVSRKFVPLVKDYFANKS